MGARPLDGPLNRFLDGSESDHAQSFREVGIHRSNEGQGGELLGPRNHDRPLPPGRVSLPLRQGCLLYTSDAADE